MPPAPLVLPATKVFLLCSGVGHVRRGYESFFEQCFVEMGKEPSLDVTLFRGAGVSSGPKERSLPAPPRSSVLTRRVGRVLRWTPGRVEQFVYTARLVPYLIREKPDVLYFSQERIGKLLVTVRRRTGLRYRLLFRNGGPQKPPFPLWDAVHQLSPVHHAAAMAAGEPPEKHLLVANAVSVDPEITLLSASERRALRGRLGLPSARPLLLCVGAVNSGHKRIDYVIREVASLPPEKRPFLLVLGQKEAETPTIEALGQTLLGEDGCAIQTVPSERMPDYYHAADMFTLASLWEGFGRAYAEALSYGLPCLVDDNAMTRYIFGDYGIRADLSRPGALAHLIQKAFCHTEDEETRRQRHRHVYETFSWEALRPAYVQMLRWVAGA